MGENSGIPWTDHTFNPWWGCHKVSAGCKHCYAATLANRFDLKWGKNYRFFDQKHWNNPVRWNRKAGKTKTRARVFCGSMCDIFETPRGFPQVPKERAKTFELIEKTPNLDWLLLTKRPKNINKLLPKEWFKQFPSNVWLGVTVENQAEVHNRINLLVDTPATVKFVSAEPILGPIKLRKLGKINWVIVGAESGPKARPMDLNWVRSLRDQSVKAKVPFFFKQKIVGGLKIELPELDGKQWAQFPNETF